MSDESSKKRLPADHHWLIAPPEAKTFEQLLGLQELRLCIEGDAAAPGICTPVPERIFARHAQHLVDAESLWAAGATLAAWNELLEAAELASFERGREQGQADAAEKPLREHLQENSRKGVEVRGRKKAEAERVDLLATLVARIIEAHRAGGITTQAEWDAAVAAVAADWPYGTPAELAAELAKDVRLYPVRSGFEAPERVHSPGMKRKGR
ncbi:hypothetical protein [Luteimonas changyuni]|uniref:hypothetical protein n=1 Tax=Luteimonas sp. MJ145 TaxID=3129234 RepID=UPI0031BAAF45